MFIYRPEVYDKEETRPEDQGIAEIIVGKQRNGPTGSVKLAFLNGTPGSRSSPATGAIVIRQTVARVDLGAIRSNFRAIAGFLAAGPGRPPGVVAVVKANAYGHGAAAGGAGARAGGRGDAGVRRHRGGDRSA